MKSPSVVLLWIASLSTMAVAPGAATAAVEAQFDTRAIQPCGEPVRSQPNTKEIEALIRCKYEKKTSDRIMLVEDIKVQAGGTRAYNQFSDGYATSIDTSAKVLPIRGSLTTYQCDTLSKFSKASVGRYYVDNTNKNCLVVKQPNAEGKCFKTTFGDWWCGMQELIGPENFLHDQPPPR